MKHWIQTHSSAAFDLDNPQPDQIRIGDISRALSNAQRFTGHARDSYSVAEHCVHVSHLVPARFALAGLLHDASEAYTGDLSSPLKLLLRSRTDAFDLIEQRIQGVINVRFSLAPHAHLAPEIKAADLAMLARERKELLGRAPRAWDPLPAPARRDLRYWGASSARLAFEQRFSELLPSAGSR